MQITVETAGPDLDVGLRAFMTLLEGAKSGAVEMPEEYNAKKYFEFEGRWFTLRVTTTGYTFKEARERITPIVPPKTAKGNA